MYYYYCQCRRLCDFLRPPALYDLVRCRRVRIERFLIRRVTPPCMLTCNFSGNTQVVNSLMPIVKGLSLNKLLPPRILPLLLFLFLPPDNSAPPKAPPKEPPKALIGKALPPFMPLVIGKAIVVYILQLYLTSAIRPFAARTSLSPT